MNLLDMMRRAFGLGGGQAGATERTDAPAVPVIAVGDAVGTSGPAVTGLLLARLGVRQADAWALALSRPCRAYAITTKWRLAHFLATAMHESGDFSRLVESLNYTPEGLMRTWPARFPPQEAARLGRRNGQIADQKAIAERAYGGRMGNGPEGSGDGYLYRGRGLIQITGRDNYRAAASALGIPLAGLPAWLETREGAATSAAWWWATHGCNVLADENDVVAIRRRVNGGEIGLDDVRLRVGRVLAAMA